MLGYCTSRRRVGPHVGRAQREDAQREAGTREAEETGRWCHPRPENEWRCDHPAAGPESTVVQQRTMSAYRGTELGQPLHSVYFRYQEFFYTTRGINTPNFRTTPHHLIDNPTIPHRGCRNVTHVNVDACSSVKVAKLDFLCNCSRYYCVISTLYRFCISIVNLATSQTVCDAWGRVKPLREKSRPTQYKAGPHLSSTPPPQLSNPRKHSVRCKHRWPKIKHPTVNVQCVNFFRPSLHD